MIPLRTALMLSGLMILPGSCIAASSESTPRGPEQSTIVAKPIAPPAPIRIGAFELNRAPQQGGLSFGVVPAGTKRLAIDGRDVDFAADRRFVVGFGRDYAATATISAFLSNGETITERLPVSPTRWIVENLSRLPHHVQPDAEFKARRPAELAQINAARHRTSDTEGWRQTFIWPVLGRISGAFGSQRIYAGQPGAPHGGVDIAGITGTPVVAPADGVVILAAASPFTLEGNLLMIDHGMGLNSAFLHLSRIDAKLGDHVRRGQTVGAIGMTGRATGPHLHWGMKWHDERIDPATLPPNNR